MRGSMLETKGEQGYSFFLHKGVLGMQGFPNANFKMYIFIESMHCPPTSDCRVLITLPLSKCQTEAMLKYFNIDGTEVRFFT